MERAKQCFARWWGWLWLAPLMFWMGAFGAVGMGKRAEAVTPSPGYRVGQNYPAAVKPILIKFGAPNASASLSAAAPAPGDVVPNSNFDTIKDTGVSPPDGAIAAGPSQLLVAANNAFQVRSLNRKLLFETKLTDAYNPVISEILELDFATWLPEYRNNRLSFDQVSQRFFFLTNVVAHPIVEPNTGTRADISGCILLVSRDADALHGWYMYLLFTYRSDANPATPISLGNLIDPASLPTPLPEHSGMTALGYDKSAIYLGFDMRFTNTRTFSGNELFIVDKAKALKGEAIEPKVLHDIFVPRPGPLVGQGTPLDFYASGLRPVEGATTTAPGLVMNYHQSAGLVLYKVNNALTSPVVENVILHGTPYPPAPPALQSPTSTTLLPTGGTDLAKTTFRKNLIYTAHTVGNAVDGSVGPAQIRWYVYNLAAGELKQGTIADAAQSFFHPSFVPDNFGKAALVFHASGPLNVPSINHAFYDGSAMSLPPKVIAASDSTYEWKDGNQQSAWGNYTDACTDVALQTQVWVQGQLVLAPPDPPDPAFPYWIYWRLHAARILTTPPPAAPSNLAAQALSSEEVKLTWKDNSNNEQGFRIERKTGDEPYKGVGGAPANATSFNDKTVVGGKTYTYRMRSYIGGTFSDYSNTANATTPLPLPAAPSDLTATATATNVARLAWKDNTIYEQGFRIERKLGTGAYSQVGTTGINETAFDSTGLTAGSTYTFRVRAYNSSGNSPFSNEASVTMPAPPVAPTTLKAVLKPIGQVVLTWLDNSANEDGFRVERKAGAGAYAEIKTLPANTKTYTDAPDPGATYTYRVRAYKGVASSAYSNEASVAMPAAPAAPSNLQATLVNGQVKLTWTDSANNELGFKIERKSQYDFMSPHTEIGSVGANVTTYTDTTLTTGGYYSYRVRAWNNGAYSAYAEVFVYKQQ